MRSFFTIHSEFQERFPCHGATPSSPKTKKVGIGGCSIGFFHGIFPIQSRQGSCEEDFHSLPRWQKEDHTQRLVPGNEDLFRSDPRCWRSCGLQRKSVEKSRNPNDFSDFRVVFFWIHQFCNQKKLVTFKEWYVHPKDTQQSCPHLKSSRNDATVALARHLMALSRSRKMRINISSDTNFPPIPSHEKIGWLIGMPVCPQLFSPWLSSESFYYITSINHDVFHRKPQSFEYHQ